MDVCMKVMAVSEHVRSFRMREYNAPTLLPGCAAGKARAATEGARLIGQLDLDTVEPVMILQRTFADWTCSATQPTA